MSMDETNDMTVDISDRAGATVTIDPEDKLDEDFLFYLAYTKAFFGNLEESQEIELCEAWLQKLCAQSVSGLSAKRSRNIYLSNLILGMLEGQLTGPFNDLPPKGKLTNAIHVFGPELPHSYEDVELEDEMNLVAVDMGSEFTHSSLDGRTYVASKTLPDGRGAFGFISLALGEQDGPVCDPCEENAEEAPAVPELTKEVKELLASRNSGALRSRVLRFYDDTALSIEGELEGMSKANDSVELMLSNLDSDMKCKYKKEKLKNMCPEKRRQKMLEMLRDKVLERRQKVHARGLALDDLEALVKSQQKDSGPHENILLQEADAELKERNLMNLRAIYPECIIERFNELLKKEKRRILQRERARLQKFETEVEKDQIAIIKEGRDKYATSKKEWQEVAEAVDAVRRVMKKGKDAEIKKKAQIEKSVEGRKHMESLIDEVGREQESLELTLNNNKLLRELIQGEMDKSQGLVACSNESRDKLRRDNNSLRKEIHELYCENRAKELRVAELQQMVDGTYNTDC